MRKYVALSAAILILFTSIFIFVGCPSDSAPGATPTVEETRQVIQGASVGYPPKGDPANETFGMISFIDLFVMVANLYLDTEIFDWQGSNGTYSFSYSYGGDDFTLTLRIVWDEAKGMWHYTLTLDGTIDSEPFDDFMIFEMYATPDGSRGEIIFHNPDYPDDYLAVTWDKGTTYITFTMSAQFDSDSFTVTLKETIPVYDPVDEVWRSESGRLRIEVPPDTVEEITWGPSPPDF